MVGEIRGKQPGKIGYSGTPQTSRGTQQNQCFGCGLCGKEKAKGRRRKGRPNPRKTLSDLLKERETLIAKSELPITGLTFTDDGLELNGVPFVAGKVSDSQIMEVAAKLIIASNPTVKVFRIARGESLGAKRLQSLIELARKEGYQGFIEEVKRGQDDLIIEEYSENE